jgi:hypothetical protein
VFGDGVKLSLVGEETRPLSSFWKVELELGCGSPVFSALWSLQTCVRLRPCYYFLIGMISCFL